MHDNNRQNFPGVLAAQIERIKEWLKPDPSDPMAVKTVKLVSKIIVMLVLLVFSPVLLVALALAFIGLM